MKANVFLVIALTLLAPLVIAISSPMAEEVGLPKLIPLALKHNPQIDIARQQVNQSKGQLTQAQSAYLPRLTAGAGVAQTYIRDLTPEDQDTVFKTSLSASQLIYDFGRTGGQIDSSAFSREAALANMGQTMQDVVFLEKRAYYLALEKMQLVAVAEEAVAIFEQHLYRAKRYFEAGVRTQIDITNAEIELAKTKLDLVRANSNVKTALVKLEQITGIKPNNGDYNLKNVAPPLANMAANLPGSLASLDSLLDTAMKTRPGLARLEQLLKAAQSSLKQAKGDYWPSLNATASYDEYETDLQTLKDQWQVGAGISWEFFSGFETDGKVAEAKGRMIEVSSSKHELELAIIQDVTDSFLRAEENRDAVKIADLTVKLAKRNLELAEGRYKAGLGDMIEFNDAQLKYTQSQSDLVSTYFAYVIVLAKIDRATGKTPEITKETVEKLLAQE